MDLKFDWVRQSFSMVYAELPDGIRVVLRRKTYHHLWYVVFYDADGEALHSIGSAADPPFLSLPAAKEGAEGWVARRMWKLFLHLFRREGENV